MTRRKTLFEQLEPRWALDGAGIVNGAFDVADPEDPQFGWDTVGDVSVVVGQARLGETTIELTELRQALSIPAGTEKLRLTIAAASLNTNPGNPPDALEVALLDSATGAPLVGAAQGLPGSDALLNINATGAVYYGPQVSVPGAGASGQVATLVYPLAVEVDLAGVAAGTAATLYIDLLGWGAVDAHLAVDDIQFAGSLAPALSLAIDPATDSGRVGDQYTSFTTVNLVGTTDPGQEVLLDVDGDGFDDGTVTAGAEGRFRFDNIAFSAGDNPMRVQATNAHGTTTIARSFTQDSDAITGTLATPPAGSIVEEDLGFVEIQWTDAGTAGPQSASFDTGDVTITGVTVDRIEDVGNGRVQYWYNDDGQSLPWGKITVTQNAGRVEDRAGNGNLERIEQFARLRASCAWQNPDAREDVDRSGVVVPLDALYIINHLNAQGSGALPVPSQFPDVPPPFLDTSCDNFVSPRDVLIVINLLNARGGGESDGHFVASHPIAGDAVAARWSPVARTAAGTVAHASERPDVVARVGPPAADSVGESTRVKPRELRPVRSSSRPPLAIDGGGDLADLDSD